MIKRREPIPLNYQLYLSKKRHFRMASNRSGLKMFWVLINKIADRFVGHNDD